MPVRWPQPACARRGRRTCLGAGDPLADAVVQRRGAVERGRNLHAHPGQAAHHAADETDVEFPCSDGVRVVGGQQFHGDARCAQAFQPLASYQWIRVAQGHDHAAHTCGHQCVAAGRGAAVVAAGFQRHPRRGTVQVGASGLGRAQGHHLGVRPPGLLGVAVKHLSRLRQDAAGHARVGVGKADGVFRKQDQVFHLGCCFADRGGGGYKGKGYKRGIPSCPPVCHEFPSDARAARLPQPWCGVARGRAC